MAEGFLPPIVAVMTANIREFQAKMAEARGEMAATAESGGGKLQAFGKFAQGSFVAIGVAAVAAGALAIKFGDQYEESHALLVNAITDSHHKFSDFSKAIDAQRGPWQNLGISQAKYQGALALLVQATQDPKKAMQDMGVVADVAAARHMDLNRAAILVGKVAQGNTSILKRFGIDLGITAGGATKVNAAQTALAKSLIAYQQLLEKDHAKKKLHIGDHLALLNALQRIKDAQQKLTVVQSAGALGVQGLSDRFKGAAAAAANTLGGKMRALQAIIENLFKDLGEKLKPALEKVLDVVLGLVKWFTKHKAAAQALGITILALAAALVIAGAAFFIVENILTLGIIAAVIALIAGIVLLADHWKQIWGDIKQWTSDALNAVSDAVHTVVGPVVNWVMGVIQPFVAWWKDHWVEIQHVINDVWHLIHLYIKANMALVMGVIKIGMAAIKVIWDLWPAIYAILKTVWDLIVGVLKTAWGLITAIFSTARDVILGIVSVLLDLVSGKWGKAWDDIKKYAGKIWGDIVSGVGNFLGNIISTIVNIAKDIYNAAKKIGSSIINGVVDAIKGLASSIPSALKGVLDSIPGVGLLKKVPGLSWLAAGGNAAANHPYIVGEAGPELFIPSAGGRVVPNHQAARAGAALVGAGGGGMTINVGGITLVSPDATTAGTAVLNTLTDAAFLHERA